MLPSSSWVSLAAPAESLGLWSHKASLLQTSLPAVVSRGCSGSSADPVPTALGRGEPGAGLLSAEPARCPSGGDGSRFGGEPSAAGAASVRPRLQQEEGVPAGGDIGPRFEGGSPPRPRAGRTPK